MPRKYIKHIPIQDFEQKPHEEFSCGYNLNVSSFNSNQIQIYNTKAKFDSKYLLSSIEELPKEATNVNIVITSKLELNNLASCTDNVTTEISRYYIAIEYELQDQI